MRFLDFAGTQPGFLPDWLLESQLLNSVPRIGRRSFSPIAKFRGEGFRFYGGDMPHGSGSSYSDYTKNWKSPYGRNFGVGSRDNAASSARAGSEPGSGLEATKESFRDKRVEPETYPASRILNLGDEEYWNEILNGARKNVLDKLVSF